MIVSQINLTNQLHQINTKKEKNHNKMHLMMNKDLGRTTQGGMDTIKGGDNVCSSQELFVH